GTMDLIFEIANLMLDQITHHHAGDWPLTTEALHAATGVAGADNDEFACTNIPATNLAAASS
ncbi:MAG: nitrogenase iron-molybdenum cofactor biosynthesis protein NifN, partial [Rhodoferax sp.]